MVGSLSPSQIQAYAEQGYVSPLWVMSAADAAAALAQLRAAEAQLGSGFACRVNERPHFLLPWANALVHNRRILDAVESIVGPDIVCWGAQFFVKEGGAASFVSWHQDGTYWRMLSQAVVTAWVALTPSRPENGCMRVVPGSHRCAVSHIETFAVDNLLSRGQEAAVVVRPSEAVDIVLHPGEMSLHHSLLLHGSEPNRADYSRIGFAIRYAPTQVRVPETEADGALLVHGVQQTNEALKVAG
jgi:ectoine hydroxylase-related dioxygenase (phytanoyl-CoA dioxygenase family)